MDIMGSLVIAFSMYSRIPMPRISWTPERMKYVMCFFPLIGAVMGLALYGFEKAAGALEIGMTAYCAGGTVLPLLITGGIHMDGFLDVSDARCSLGEPEKKLGILKDPHIGAFAVIRGGIYLLLYLGVFSELPRTRIGVMGAVYVMTRAMSALALVTFPKAKKNGLAASFSGGARKGTVIFSMAGYIGGSLVFLVCHEGWLTGLLVGLAAGGMFWHYYRAAVKEFGGITGDLAGWFLQNGELGLMAATVAAGWIG